MDVKEFQHHAEECAALAAKAPTDSLRRQYAELSKVWAELASERMEMTEHSPSQDRLRP